MFQAHGRISTGVQKTGTSMLGHESFTLMEEKMQSRHFQQTVHKAKPLKIKKSLLRSVASSRWFKEKAKMFCFGLFICG